MRANPTLAHLWNTYVNPVLAPLFSNQYGLPLIQGRFNDLVAQIQSRYGGCPLGFEIVQGVCKDTAGKDLKICFGARVHAGAPKVVLYLQSLNDLLWVIHAFTNSDFARSRLLFEEYLATSIIHEFDHLASGLTGSREMPIEELVDLELRVWAETCEHTMTPLAKVYKRELSPMSMRYYQSWEDCGRNVKSQQWKAFIASLYGNLKRG